MRVLFRSKCAITLWVCSSNWCICRLSPHLTEISQVLVLVDLPDNVCLHHDIDMNNRLQSLNVHCEDKHINLSTNINK
jgi:hypothetical protein